MSKFSGRRSAAYARKSTEDQRWTDSSEQRQDLRDAADGYALDTTEDQRWVDSSEQRQDLRDAADGYAESFSELLRAADGYVTAEQDHDGYIAFFTGTDAIAGDNDLYWDRVNNNLVLGAASLIQLGGITDEFPALKRVGRDIHFRQADDNDYASIACETLDAYGEITARDRVAVHGSSDTEQLIVRASVAQSNTNPLIELQKSDGTPICALHSDDVSNVFLGIGAGDANAVAGVAGTQNTFIGRDAGGAVTSARSMVAIGALASAACTAGGSYSVRIGAGAGQLSTRSYEVMIGYAAGVNSNNSGNMGIGYKALRLTTTGAYNTAVGGNALEKNVTSSWNTAIGTQALYLNTGANNTAIGSYPCHQNTSGHDNMAIGTQALRYNKTGNYNIGLGAYAGVGVSGESFSSNTLIGYKAGFALSTGSNNFLLGFQTGDNLTTGSDNIIIGYDLDASFGDHSNQLSIGDLITGDTSAKFVNIDGYMGIIGNANTTQFIVKGNETQTNRLAHFKSYSDDSLFSIWNTGHCQNVDGFITTAPQYGPGFLSFNYANNRPEHTNGTGSYDHTGNALGEQIFTATAGDAFTQADEDGGTWILFIGANLGAFAEIKRFIDGTHVEVDGMGWVGDIASQAFQIWPHPTFVTGDGDVTEFSVGSAGQFEIFSYDFANSCMCEIKLDSAVDNTEALCIIAEVNGHNHNDALHIQYNTGALQNGDDAHVLHINVDETASAGDATTHISAIQIETTNTTASAKHAIHIGPGFDEALHVTGTPSEDPDFGYEVTTSTVVDRVNSVGGGDNAFVNVAVDQQILDNDNDYILIGDNNIFEIIEVNLATNSSQNALLEFYYSQADVGVSGWTQFFPEDGTNGFTNSGSISFHDPGDWAKDDQAEINGDILNAYYIAIVRTRNGIAIPPTEDYFKIFANQTGGMNIRGDGVVQLPYLGAAPAAPANGMMWMEADGLHIYYGGAEKVVAGV